MNLLYNLCPKLRSLYSYTSVDDHDMQSRQKQSKNWIQWEGSLGIWAHGVVGYHARLAYYDLREVLGSIPNASRFFPDLRSKEKVWHNFVKNTKHIGNPRLSNDAHPPAGCQTVPVHCTYTFWLHFCKHNSQVKKGGGYFLPGG